MPALESPGKVQHTDSELSLRKCLESDFVFLEMEGMLEGTERAQLLKRTGVGQALLLQSCPNGG